jgi:hypothetical protein
MGDSIASNNRNARVRWSTFTDPGSDSLADYALAIGAIRLGSSRCGAHFVGALGAGSLAAQPASDADFNSQLRIGRLFGMLHHLAN